MNKIYLAVFLTLMSTTSLSLQGAEKEEIGSENKLPSQQRELGKMCKTLKDLYKNPPKTASKYFKNLVFNLNDPTINYTSKTQYMNYLGEVIEGRAKELTITEDTYLLLMRFYKELFGVDIRYSEMLRVGTEIKDDYKNILEKLITQCPPQHKDSISLENIMKEIRDYAGREQEHLESSKKKIEAIKEERKDLSLIEERLKHGHRLLKDNPVGQKIEKMLSDLSEEAIDNARNTGYGAKCFNIHTLIKSKLLHNGKLDLEHKDFIDLQNYFTSLINSEKDTNTKDAAATIQEKIDNPFRMPDMSEKFGQELNRFSKIIKEDQIILVIDIKTKYDIVQDNFQGAFEFFEYLYDLKEEHLGETKKQLDGLYSSLSSLFFRQQYRD